MSLGLKFFYGAYEHPAGEVYPRTYSMRTLQTPQGRRWASEYTLTVEGQFGSSLDSALTPEQINLKIQQLDDAYLHDYKDAGFRLEDGTLTAHYMPTSGDGSLSGNRVLQKSWIHQTPTEFANTRSFNITIWAQYIQSYSDLIGFHEQVSYLGNGGPAWDYREGWTGLPQYELISAKTAISVVQRGYTEGLMGYISPPDPLLPTFEQGNRRQMIYSSPRDHGHNLPGRFTGYRLDYAYYFKLPQPNVLVANTRDF